MSSRPTAENEAVRQAALRAEEKHREQVQKLAESENQLG
jgi:hypothetical protein